MDVPTLNMDLVRQLPDKRAALRTCVLFSGRPLKSVAYDLGIDAGHLSKMLNPQEDPRHFPVEKENLLMDVCGNEIPLVWSLVSRGYDPPATLQGQVQTLTVENAMLREQLDRQAMELEQLRREQRQTINIFKNLEVR